MEGLGKERSICSSRPFPWLSHPQTEASTLLWKLKDCFSTNDTIAPHHTDKENKYMESRKALPDLKDVPPPPPHHTSSSQLSQPLSLAPLPLPSPCLPPQLAQDSQQPLPPQQHQEGASPKPVHCLATESNKVWPDVPNSQTASVPVPVPLCNGCGTSSDSMVLVPKYGSPESNGPENIPPVGVFWDIENCSVPSGRSAGAVVQRIRSYFFQGHREAEFICVCDISKESKAVIQELNNCQVTVAHINATAKNAADDKLRQSLRRFAETHTAPATVVLVSSDVNFASELSDLRHRHGFQIILVHGSHASLALLQHAHRHVAFQEITADLPPRMLVKAQDLGILEVKPRMDFGVLDKGHATSSSPNNNMETGALEHLSKPGLTGESMYRRRYKQ